MRLYRFKDSTASPQFILAQRGVDLAGYFHPSLDATQRRVVASAKVSTRVAPGTVPDKVLYEGTLYSLHPVPAQEPKPTISTNVGLGASGNSRCTCPPGFVCLCQNNPYLREAEAKRRSSRN